MSPEALYAYGWHAGGWPARPTADRILRAQPTVRDRRYLRPPGGKPMPVFTALMRDSVILAYAGALAILDVPIPSNPHRQFELLDYSIHGVGEWLDVSEHAARVRTVRHVQGAQRAILLGYPLVAGVIWPTAMRLVDGEGFIAGVDGDVVGSCGVLISGYDAGRDAFRVQPCLGVGWGQGGRAWLRTRDLKWLVQQGGELCLVMKPAETSKS